jgi:hypothetical protein
VALALGATACSSATDEVAATVEGTEITRTSLEAELDAMEADEAYRTGVEQQFQAPLRGAGEGTYDSRFMARLLSLRVYYELIDQELERRDMPVTDEDLEGVREQAVQSVGGPETFDAFPVEYQDRVVRQRALITKLGEAVAGADVEEGAAEAYYEENQGAVRVPVPRPTSSSAPRRPCQARPATDPSRGRRARRRAAGRARRRRRLHRARLLRRQRRHRLRAEGGSLDCITRQTQFDPTFLEAAFAAEVGQVTEPVETQFGFHLILVSSAEVPPFEEVEPQIQQQLASGSAGAFDEVLRTTTCGSDVDVASRYGTWDTSSCAEGGFGSVVAPEGPSTTTTAPGPGVGGGGAPDEPAGSGAGADG